MRHALVTALVLTIAIWACGGSYTGGGGSLVVPDGSFGTNPVPDAGDAGTGTLPDGGDGGTVACAASGIANAQVLDSCDNSGILVGGTIVFNKNLCTVSISFANNATPCTGSISGDNDAFDGGCGGGFTSCTSPSLPGTIVCNVPVGVGTCNIRVCSLDAGGCN
ncbi:MAG TPA: hypothetical protein VH083_27895 [Myxococcales bacterium]|jgi:hypothetical protein|nr:hypothetical protein [Myxococcales bacterium]